jgi:hypothetical protein
MKIKYLIPVALLASVGMVACQQGKTNTSSSAGANSSESPVSSSSNPSSSSGSSSSTAEAALASGLLSYQGADADTKNQLLASAERYMMKTHLGGIPIFDDGGLSEFSARLTLPSRTYIANYGFGTANGQIDATGNMYNGPIAEAVDEYKSYFHSASNQDVGTCNAWNTSGSSEADNNSIISAGYFTTMMNGDKKTYSWKGLLSKTDRPIQIDDKGNEVTYVKGTTSKYWRVKLKTGTDGVKYSTAGKYTAFDGRDVVLADYVTPFKAMCDYGLKRSADLGSGAYGIEGVKDYVSAQTSTFGSGNWAKVGIKQNDAEGSLDFTFITPRTQFQAMYGLAESMYAPTPDEFFTTIAATRKEGVTKWGTVGSSSTATENVDNIISVGPYVPVYWQSDKRLVCKKNTRYVDADNIHFNGTVEDYIPGNEYSTVAYNMFLANKLDVVGIPTAQVATHKNDANTLKSAGSSVWCMCFNTCTPEEYEYYFGKNGVVKAHSNESDYHQLMPLLNNDNFLDGVYFSIDRLTMQKKTGRTAAMAPFSDAYAVDGESGVSYRSTAAGKSVVSDYTSVNAYGYDLATAKTLFQKAVEQCENAGTLTPGTEAEPTPISFDMDWQATTIITQFGGDYKAYIEDAFNAACPKYKLTMNNVAHGDVDYNISYNNVKEGNYDAMMGSISGSTLDALNMLNIYSSTNSFNNGFHLCYGERTDIVSTTDPIVFDNKEWSFDALFVAANGTAIVSDGLVTNPVTGHNDPVIDSTANTITFSYKIPTVKNADGSNVISYKLYIDGENGAGYHTFADSGLTKNGSVYHTPSSDDMTFSQTDTAWNITFTKAKLQEYVDTCAADSGAAGNEYMRISLDYTYYLNGSETEAGSGYYAWVVKIADLGLTVK